MRKVESTSAASAREVLPVTPGEHGTNLLWPWLYETIERISELRTRPDNWDSYGASRLSNNAIVASLNFLARFRYAIQSAPLISLTGEGGLLFSWNNAESSVELTFNPQELPWVYYSDSSIAREWEGHLHEGELIEKWLWRASSIY
ncbi:hypothetical protein SK803_40810 [Lentzea sp. BCCO 10_0856]|uniref:Uncharacterized protein n=1 Tax=Lentzea miocenica TaxID=3095431 RepID=A0ABU4TEI1_9PSEU|nr:hypothetical protein [Lentzea sp. BCCO 10_0856]MDX8036573.1 hypothetical protein [Lentzea sp. BCCO 10_0856]